MKAILSAFFVVAALAISLPAHAWKQKEFVVSFWGPPPPTQTTADRYAQIAGAGFTTVLGGNGVSGPEPSRAMLDQSRQHKLKAFVLDDRLYGGKAAGVSAVVKEYGSHPALEGYLVQDEPGTSQFPALKETVAALKKADGKRLALINLLPTYATPAQLGAPDYETYVKQFLDTVRPDVLCFDHYPFLTTGERADYLENLEIIRRQSVSKKVPFWTFVQAEGIQGAYRSPTEMEMRSQVFTALAYGAKGILYFTYWTPDPGAERHFDGIITREGDARARYEWTERLNAQIDTLAPLLMSMKSRDVFYVTPPPSDDEDESAKSGEKKPDSKDADKAKTASPLPRGTKPVSDTIFKEVSGGPALLGMFDGPDGKRFFWLVNRSTTNSTKVFVHLNDSRAARLFEHGLDGSVSTNLVRTDLKLPASYETRLGPGEARLFEIPEVYR